MNRELLEKIKKIDGRSSKSEIGALFREFEDELTPETVELLRGAYKRNFFDDENSYRELPNLSRQRIKENSAFVRRSVVLAVVNLSIEPSDPKTQAMISDFLSECIQDPEHEVRNVVFSVAPDRFNGKQLYESYTRIRSLIKDENVSMPYQLDEYSAARRAIIRAMGEKLSIASEDERREIIEYVHSVIRKPLDPDPSVLAAAAQILGYYGSHEHVESLKEIIPTQEYPAHLRAEKAVGQIITRHEKAMESSKKELLRKIQAIDISIKVLQEQKRILRRKSERM